MTPNPFLGVVLHAVGGFAAGSFYIPFKKVRGWAWESYWFVGGVFSWIVAPVAVAALTVPDLAGVLAAAPLKSLFLCFLFGVLWGVGGLTFGLSMRYLGMSLGYAVALGFCAAFGTVIPPMVTWEIAGMVTTLSGLVTLAGVPVCLAGIALCGRAGMRKEREVSDEQKRAAVREFNFVRGLWVALAAGVMSACMAFVFAAGKPIAEQAVAAGVRPVFQNFPVLVVALAGGFLTNGLWCAILSVRNGTARDFVKGPSAAGLIGNYVFAALAGVTWYFQFFFYGMGTTKMGEYDFSSWTIHMAFIIVFSNLWGIYFREWRGSSRRTRALVVAGIVVLVASTVVVGVGNYLAD